MYIVYLVLSHEGLAGRCEPSWDCSKCHVTIRFLPSPLPTLLPSWNQERTTYINWVLRKNSSVHSVTVTWSCDTLVLTASSSSSTATSSPFFNIPWDRVGRLFFRLSLCLFFGWFPLAFNRCFPTLLLAPLAQLTWSSLLSCHHENHPLIWLDLSLMSLPWVSLVFECLWPPHKRSSFPSDFPQNYLIWVDSIQTIPLSLYSFPPWLSFRDGSHIIYIVHSLCIHFMIPFCCFLFSLFKYSLSNCFICWLMPLLLIIDIFVWYRSFFWFWKCIPGI